MIYHNARHSAFYIVCCRLYVTASALTLRREMWIAEFCGDEADSAPYLAVYANPKPDTQTLIL